MNSQINSPADLSRFGGGFYIKAPGYCRFTPHFPAALIDALMHAYVYDDADTLAAFEPQARVEDANGLVLWRPVEPLGPLLHRTGLTALINTFWPLSM